MNTFLAAIKDLWSFLWGKENSSPAETFLIGAPPVLNKLPEATAKQPLTETENHRPLESRSTELMTNKGYVSVAKTRVFVRPVFSHDGVLTWLSYGATVSILEHEGRFTRIALGESSGWVLKDDLTNQVNEVFPEFISGKVYEADHEDTIKVRHFINDEFFAKELMLPLQATEFVYYQLLKSGRRIDWSQTRPRQAGDWQNILKGRMGIKMGLIPKTGSILEYNDESGRGFLGYTKAVRVDESIIVESVGHYEVGEYKEELIEKQQWQNWRPVWISVN